MKASYVSIPAIQNDDSDDEGFVMEIEEIERSDEINATKSGASSNANTDEIEYDASNNG